ncbi:MAG: class I SAM-dependent methyltransferase, partial [Limisphaerales bacterium]
LNILTNKMAELKIKNVKPILGTITDPKLPANSVDTILMVDVYHEFDHPHEMMQAMGQALKRGGRMIFVEYRAEDANVPIKKLHKMSETQVRKEAEIHSLVWAETITNLPRQHIIICKRK